MKELPLLQFTTELFPDVNLENITIIAIQHAIDITHLMFLELYKKGLKPSNTYLLGKCYSSNKGTAEDVKESGAYVSELSFTFDSHESFDEQYPKYVKSFIKEFKQQRIVKKDNNKIIIVDDGGFLIREILNDKELLGDVMSTTELTSSGFHSLKDLPVLFPIVNIARSKAKLEIEGTMIAGLEVKHIENIIEKENLKNGNILIIGGGAIGEKVHNILKSKSYNSEIYDINKNLSTIDELEKSFETVDVIIGATGSNSVSEESLKKLNRKVLLISTSSSDREFPATSIRNNFAQNSDPHKDYYYEKVVLINSGFPVNFTGDRVSLPLEQVQLTDSLILSAIFQSSKEVSTTGFVALDESVQNKIVEEFIILYPEYSKHW